MEIEWRKSVTNQVSGELSSVRKSDNHLKRFSM